LTLLACYLAEALLVSFNISKAKKTFSHAKQKVSSGETTRFDVSCDVEVPVKGFWTAWKQRWFR